MDAEPGESSKEDVRMNAWLPIWILGAPVALLVVEWFFSRGGKR